MYFSENLKIFKIFVKAFKKIDNTRVIVQNNKNEKVVDISDWSKLNNIWGSLTNHDWSRNLKDASLTKITHYLTDW